MAQVASANDIRPLADEILSEALRLAASDIHVEPAADQWEIRYRIDGILQTFRRLEPAVGKSIVSRLMVMARLLTYRQDVPQEGRIPFSDPVNDPTNEARSVEFRLAIMPTIHGLRAAIRTPAEHLQLAVLEELGLPQKVLAGLRRFLENDSGMLILTGPAGSGKTTTIYALLREIARTRPGISIIALEDPVERDLPGITQIEVSPFGQLTYEKALRSILRHDPQVLMLGEIRDAATASIAVQAALCGHRLITTLHAATPGGAITRLLEMGIEPYQLTSSIHGIVSQRLLRRKSQGSAGYRGRAPIGEFVEMDRDLKRAVLQQSDADALQRIYRSQPGNESLAAAGQNLIEQGLTDEAELHRVLGAQAGR